MSPLRNADTLKERFRDAFIYAVVLVVLLLGASAVVQGSSQKLVEQVANNTRRSAESVDGIQRLVQAQTCILSIDPDKRTSDTVNKCFTAAGVPAPTP